MSLYARPIIIGVIVFVIVMALILLVISLVANSVRSRAKKPSFMPSLKRLSAKNAKEDERLKRSRIFPTKKKKGPEERERFYAFGGVIAAIFGTLAVRLWSLQVLSSEEYLRAATENMTSDVSTPAIRGRILDRNGVELVTNRPSIVLTGKRTIVNDRGLTHRLSLLLGIPKGVIRRNLLDDTNGAQADHVIAAEVPMRAVAFIKEHPMLFEGINVEQRSMRYYPYGSLGAHILGYTGPVTENDLNAQTEDSAHVYQGGDIIGKDGAEFQFERFLRGERGTRTYRIDSAGTPTDLLEEYEPISGEDVYLTIDVNLQRSTDRILAETVAAARAKGRIHANGGAIVCIDVKDGGILAASSYPTFFPAELSSGISIDLWNQLIDEAANKPLFHRAISGMYPAASTFKAFTSMAGLEYGIIGDNTQFRCSGHWDEYGEEWAQNCWIYPGSHGYLPLEEALNISCDIFFYNVAHGFWLRNQENQANQENQENQANQENQEDNLDEFQNSLKSWGFHSKTGIDLPQEATGVIPDKVWKREVFKDTPEDASWNPGDLSNMAIGQGDMLITPLQLANGYATIARKSAIKPHVFYKVVGKNGETIRAHTPEPSDMQPKFEERNLNRVIEGLKRVIAREGIFRDIPVALAGKSGTAEVAGKDDYSWFVAYGPVDDPQYCVACVIEQGGGGSSSAIMGVLHTFAAIYDKDAGSIIAGNETGER